MKFYNDTDNRQCSAVDEHGLDCAAPEGHDGLHANVNGEWSGKEEAQAGLPDGEHHYDTACGDRPYCEIPQHHALEDMR